MHIHADRDRCEGHSVCADAAPEVHNLGDDATVVVLHEGEPADLARKAEAGAQARPIAALPLTA